MSNLNLSPEKAQRLTTLIHRVVADPRYGHFANVKKIVDALGVEPRAGFVANELAVDLGGGVVVSVEGRARRGSVAIVRYHGHPVLNQADITGHTLYEPGEWEQILTRSAEIVDNFGDEPPLLADLSAERAA